MCESTRNKRDRRINDAKLALSAVIRMAANGAVISRANNASRLVRDFACNSGANNALASKQISNAEDQLFAARTHTDDKHVIERIHRALVNVRQAQRLHDKLVREDSVIYSADELHEFAVLVSTPSSGVYREKYYAEHRDSVVHELASKLDAEFLPPMHGDDGVTQHDIKGHDGMVLVALIN